jgi:ribonuclease Z
MEKVKIVVLGSAASAPTKDRNLSSVALKYMGNWLLFECPEGNQRQMMTYGVSYMKISHIFLSHFHGDHVLGLPGLLATMSMHQRDSPITIVGPKGVKELVRKAIELSMIKVNFEINTIEARKGIIVQENDFYVRAFPLAHDVPCFGYAFKQEDKLGEFSRKKALELEIPEGPLWGKLQKGEVITHKGKKIKPAEVLDETKAVSGKKISVVFDTRPNKIYFNEVKESDLLVHEATFNEKMLERAKETRHSTAKEAARVAGQTHCKKLLLIHISARHKEEQELGNEAKTEFDNVVVAMDGLEMDI